MNALKGIKIFVNQTINRRNNIYKLMCELANLFNKNISNELKDYCLDSINCDEIEDDIILLIKDIKLVNYKQRKNVLSNYLNKLKQIKRCGINTSYSRYIFFLNSILN